MKMITNDGNQYQALARVYKHNLKGRAVAVEYQEYKARGDGGCVGITVKYDGEFDMPVLEAGQEGKIYSPGEEGIVRWDFEAAREFERTLKAKGYKSGIFYAELYGADKDDKPVKFNRVYSLIMSFSRASTVDKELRLAVFDIDSLDGKKVEEKNYWKRYELIHSIFAGCRFCHPVIAKQSGGVELFEKYVNSEGFEGLVIRTDNKVLKVKNLFTFDAVIYGIKKAGKLMAGANPVFGSVYIAVLLPNGDMLDLGSVGNGWETPERRTLYDELIKEKFDEDSKMIYVKPKHIIEVAYNEMMTEKTARNMGPIKADGTFDTKSRKMSPAYSPRFPRRISFTDPAKGITGDYPMISPHPKKATADDIGVNQIPEIAMLYNIDDAPSGTLTPAASSNLAEEPIKVKSSTIELKKNDDVFKQTPLVRTPAQSPFEFVASEGSNLRELMVATKMPLDALKKELTQHVDVGNLTVSSTNGKYYRAREVPFPLTADAVFKQPDEKSTSPTAIQPSYSVYAALKVSDSPTEAEASQLRRVAYYEKVLPYMLEKTMGYPLAIVNFSKETGPMPLVRNIGDAPIVIASKDEIPMFMNRTGKFDKAGTKAFSKGLITLYYVPSVEALNIKVATVDFDILNIDEKLVRPYVIQAVTELEAKGYLAQAFFTGSSWHVVFRKPDCSSMGEYGGINVKTGMVAEIMLPLADKIKISLRTSAAHLQDKITLDYTVNKANGPIRFPLSLHKTGLGMIPVGKNDIIAFDRMEAHPDNILKNVDKYKRVVDEVYKCLGT